MTDITERTRSVPAATHETLQFVLSRRSSDPGTDVLELARLVGDDPLADRLEGAYAAAPLGAHVGMALRRAWVVQQLGSVVWAFGVGRLGERSRSAAPGFDDDLHGGGDRGD